MKNVFICFLMLSVQWANAVIITPPKSQIVHVGDSVTFTVVAKCDSPCNSPLTYQWEKCTSVLMIPPPACLQSNIILGAKDASYTIKSVMLTDSGSYLVRIGNNSTGYDESPIAWLTVIPPVFVQNINQQKLNSINAYVASHVIHINHSIQNRTDSAKFILYDINGRIVWQKSIVGQQEQTYKPTTAGTYILRMVTVTNTFEKKLIYTP